MVLAHEFRPIFGVEEFALGFVSALVGVRSEEVTLSLKKVRGKSLGAVGVVVCE